MHDRTASASDHRCVVMASRRDRPLRGARAAPATSWSRSRGASRPWAWPHAWRRKGRSKWATLWATLSGWTPGAAPALASCSAPQVSRHISHLRQAGHEVAVLKPPLQDTILYAFLFKFCSKPALQCKCASALPGVVLRRLLNDPVLEGVTHVVVDEVHERSADSDLLLLLLRDVLRAGSNCNLRIILMSATAEADAFVHYFDAALDKVCCTSGRSSSTQCQNIMRPGLYAVVSRCSICIFCAGNAGELCLHCKHCWLHSPCPGSVFGGCSGADWLSDWPHLQVSQLGHGRECVSNEAAKCLWALAPTLCSICNAADGTCH